MPKKKSYMDIKNILSEGIFAFTMDKIFKYLYLNPALKDDKKVKCHN